VIAAQVEKRKAQIQRKLFPDSVSSVDEAVDTWCVTVKGLPTEKKGMFVGTSVEGSKKQDNQKVLQTEHVDLLNKVAMDILHGKKERWK
jgi:hypothetical protein